MSKNLAIAASLVLTALSLPPIEANAATSKARNIVYLNANGDVIGQRVLACNNNTRQGGLFQGSYTFTLTQGCGDQTVVCNNGNCGDPSPPDYTFSISMSATLRATGVTTSDLCMAYFQSECHEGIIYDWVGSPYGVNP